MIHDVSHGDNYHRLRSETVSLLSYEYTSLRNCNVGREVGGRLISPSLSFFFSSRFDKQELSDDFIIYFRLRFNSLLLLDATVITVS